jgi:hypothetical protein
MDGSAQNLRKLERERSVSKFFPDGITVWAPDAASFCEGPTCCVQADDMYERVWDSLSQQVRPLPRGLPHMPHL